MNELIMLDKFGNEFSLDDFMFIMKDKDGEYHEVSDITQQAIIQLDLSWRIKNDLQHHSTQDS